MIVEKIRRAIPPGTVIPKPKAKAEFVVKAWGRRRGEPALIYTIPNRKNPTKPSEKGVTESELERAYEQLQRSEQLTHAWFKKNFPKCMKEGPCNFTTIGGIFELLGEARYSTRGVYTRRR